MSVCRFPWCKCSRPGSRRRHVITLRSWKERRSVCEPAPGLRWAYIYASDASFAAVPGGGPSTSSPARADCISGLVSHPARLCQGPLCVHGPKRKSAPSPPVSLHVHVLLGTTPSPRQGCSSHFLHIHSLIASPQTASPLLVSCMAVNGQWFSTSAHAHTQPISLY